MIGQPTEQKVGPALDAAAEAIALDSASQVDPRSVHHSLQGGVPGLQMGPEDTLRHWLQLDVSAGPVVSRASSQEHSRQEFARQDFVNEFGGWIVHRSRHGKTLAAGPKQSIPPVQPAT